MDKPRNLLLHHAVIKADSTTTKFQTVFHASCKSKSGHSLNDVLLDGQAIQDTLVMIVIRCQIFDFVVSVDIEKKVRTCSSNASSRFAATVKNSSPYLLMQDFQQSNSSCCCASGAAGFVPRSFRYNVRFTMGALLQTTELIKTSPPHCLSDQYRKSATCSIR